MSTTSAPLAAPGRTWPPPRPRHHQHRRLPHPGCFRILLVHSHVQISLPLGDEKGGRWPFLGHRSAHPGTNAHRPPASLSSRACSTYPARSTMPVTGPWLQPALFPPRKRQRRSLPRRAAKLPQSAVPACVPCSTCSVIRLLCR